MMAMELKRIVHPELKDGEWEDRERKAALSGVGEIGRAHV